MGPSILESNTVASQACHGLLLCLLSPEHGDDVGDRQNFRTLKKSGQRTQTLTIRIIAAEPRAIPVTR